MSVERRQAGGNLRRQVEFSKRTRIVSVITW
jgi:hypothetical protein